MIARVQSIKNPTHPKRGEKLRDEGTIDSP